MDYLITNQLETLEQECRRQEHNEHAARIVLMESVMRRIEADHRLRMYLAANPEKVGK